MSDDVRFFAIGAYLYGALTLAGIFVAGIAVGNKWAAILALVASGAAYLSQLASAMAFGAGRNPVAGLGLMAVSIAAGALGLVSLIWG